MIIQSLKGLVDFVAVVMVVVLSDGGGELQRMVIKKRKG